MAANLIIMQWNCFGINAHLNELKNFLTNSTVSPSVICLQETFLKDKNCFKLNNYETIRRDRRDQQKGGWLHLLKLDSTTK